MSTSALPADFGRTLDIPPRFVGRTVRDLFAHFRKQHAILVGLVSEAKALALEDMLKDTEGNFIDAFIQTQFAQSESLEERSRFRVRVNPSDDEPIHEGEAAMVIMRQIAEELTD